MPTISVIVPTYNRAHLVGEALQSLVAQTFDDWEVIVVDDGSTDNTAEVVAGMGDGRIRLLRVDHGERSRARNHGLAQARGEFISFLDDDDLYLPHKMAAEVAFLQAHPEVDMVCGGTQFVDHQDLVRYALEPWVIYPEPTLHNALLGRCSFHMCSVALRRSALARMDHGFDPAFSLAEDADFFLRLGLSGARLAWLPCVVAAYRILHTDRSLRILLDYSRGYRRMLDAFFARNDLPADVRASRDMVYLRFHLFCACRAYACRAEKLAQRELLQAAVLTRDGDTEEVSQGFVDMLIRSARNGWMVSDAREYIDYVFDHLPTPLIAFYPLRQEALAALDATEAVSEGERI